MSIKLYTVKCSVHGTYEISATSSSKLGNCIKISNGKFCNKPLKRVYNVPAVHYKGTGWGGR